MFWHAVLRVAFSKCISEWFVRLMSELQEVHLGISCPPIKFPDYYGIDTPNINELISSNIKLNKINEIVGATSVFFLSLEGTYKAMGYERRDQKNPQKGHSHHNQSRHGDPRGNFQKFS